MMIGATTLIIGIFGRWKNDKMDDMVTADFLIIGGGVVGLSIARALRKEYSDASVVVIEKEPTCGQHASGRNSGVIHAGFYYSPDSLKARLTRQGNILLTEYCIERGVPLKRCGKLVVTKNEDDFSTLDELFERGRKNGVPLQEVSAEDIREIEPRAKTHKRALFSPTTSALDPAIFLQTLVKDVSQSGVQIYNNTTYLGRKWNQIITQSERFSANFIINAAGLYADRIAQDFGFGKEYRIVPFKGLYLLSNEPVGAFKTHIYPVPCLNNPFLGVHITVSTDGQAKLGPTALPALWREHYQGFDNFHLKELLEISLAHGRLLFTSSHFRRLAVQELLKYSRGFLISEANYLARGILKKNFLCWGKSGIRAQLVNSRHGRLVMDFVLEGDKHSFHILNTVSPGLTCAFSFAEYVCRKIR